MVAYDHIVQRRKLLHLSLVVLIAGVALIGFLILRPIFTQPGTIVWDRGERMSMPRFIPEIEVSPREIPDIAGKLAASHSRVSYAAFAFNRLNETDPDEALNIQLSMEDGKLGFDWVLLGQPNIDDLELFLDFLDAKGLRASDMTQNGVRFFRVENGDVDQLAISVVTEMYGLPVDTSLGLYHEGFDWPEE